MSEVCCGWQVCSELTFAVGELGPCEVVLTRDFTAPLIAEVADVADLVSRQVRPAVLRHAL